MNIIAIDPGSTESAWLRLTGGRPDGFGKLPNVDLRRLLDRTLLAGVDAVVIEQMQSYGMPVGREVFDAVFESGRFAELADFAAVPTFLLSRKRVVGHLCGSARAKDANVRAALLERFGGAGAKGTKAAPGPLYGVAADVWSALALAVTFEDGVRP